MLDAGYLIKRWFMEFTGGRKFYMGQSQVLFLVETKGKYHKKYSRGKKIGQCDWKLKNSHAFQIHKLIISNNQLFV